MIKTIIYVIIISVLEVACEREADNVTPPEFKQKIVIGSFLSPNDSITYVNISSNQSIFGVIDKNWTITGAKAFISDGTNEIQMDTSKLGFKFNHRIMNIVAGKTYHIRVEADNGLKAEASCLIPAKQNFNLKIDTVTKVEIAPNGYSSSYFFIQFKFNDIPKISNFYLVKGSIYQYGQFDDYSLYPVISKHFAKMTSDLNFLNPMFNDQGQDGLQMQIDPEKLYSTEISNVDSVFIVISLLNANKDYYSYQQSLNNYNDTNDPLTQETPIFSNIVGGIGVFAGYTMDSVVMRIVKKSKIIKNLNLKQNSNFP